MKSLLRVLTVSFVAYSLAVFATQAQDLGIQFSKMPVGTKAYYNTSYGEKWLDIYIGKKRGLYAVRRYKGHTKNGKLLQVNYFDEKGRRVHYTGQRGLKVLFKPIDCDYHFGDCVFTIRIRGEAYVQNGQNKTYNQSIVKKDGKYVSTWYRGTQTDKKGGSLFTLGKYNLRKKVQFFNDGLQTIDLVKVE